MHSFILCVFLLLTLTSCSSNSNNKTNSSSTDLYHGGETVDGYTLPPMPNPTENNKDIFGIDTNDNGIRDDIEIYIYNRFQGYTNSKVEREIAMQWARTATRLIQNPETAYEDKKYELTERAISCEYYYYNTYMADVSYEEWLRYTIKHDVLNAEFEDVIYNTKERLKAYFRYNKSMSGHVFDDLPNTKEACDFDIDAILER